MAARDAEILKLKMDIQLQVTIFLFLFFIDGSYTKRTRAHTHAQGTIREWLLEPKGSSLEYI